MRFKSRTEGITYAIWRISSFDNTTLTENEIKSIDRCINLLQNLLDRHEQDSIPVIQALEFLKKRVSCVLYQQTINILQEVYLNSDFEQSPQEKFENPLGRRLESELGIELIQNPTTAMMESVGLVSYEITKILEFMDDEDRLNSKLYQFQQDFHSLSFGAFQSTPSVNELLDVLELNESEQLAKIMFIHFRFGQFFFPLEPVIEPNVRMPVGELKNIIQQCYFHSDLAQFFATKLQKRTPPLSDEPQAQGITLINSRNYIANEKFYKSPLYTALRDRGRDGPLDNFLTEQMGLMLLSQQIHETNLPMHYSAWSADCKFQKADLSSEYVKDLIDNDAVYVAGPSGMTGVLLGQMEILANFETEDLKKNYLSAVVAYMQSGGYHSLHEVVGPAEYVLKLVPGYQVEVPRQGALSPPPNFDRFYAQQMQIDPEFNERYQTAYSKYLDYFESVYMPEMMPLEELKFAITFMLDDFLTSLGIDCTNTNFLSCNDFSHLKAQVAFKYRALFNYQTNLTELKKLLAYMEREFTSIIPKQSLRFFLVNDEKIEALLDEITFLCDDFEKFTSEKSALSHGL